MQNISDIHVESIKPLPPPSEYERELPIGDKIAAGIAYARETIANIVVGKDSRLLVLVGPCSIHDTIAGLEYADRLAALSRKLDDRIFIVMRGYFEKPRTTVGWKGLIYDPHLDGTLDIPTGLYKARKFLLEIAEIGLPVATEFVDPITPQYLADLISWAAIGARTAESQTHRQMASGLSMPVGFKNGTGGTIQLGVDAVVAARAGHGFLGVDHEGRASIVVTKGNPYCHLVLRGGSRGPNYDPQSIADAIKRLTAAGVNPRLMVDCSHGNSGKDHSRQPDVFRNVLQQRVIGNANIIGLMVESNLCEGSQTMREKNHVSELEYGVSITDPCIDWDTTAQLLIGAHQLLKADMPTDPLEVKGGEKICLTGNETKIPVKEYPHRSGKFPEVFSGT